MARYTIHTIIEPDFSAIDAAEVFATESQAAAQAYVVGHSHQRCYGYCILDHEDQRVDFGTEVRALADVAQLEMSSDDAPELTKEQMASAVKRKGLQVIS